MKNGVSPIVAGLVDLIKNSALTQAGITLTAMFMSYNIYMSGRIVPDWLIIIISVSVGFYFRTKNDLEHARILKNVQKSE